MKNKNKSSANDLYDYFDIPEKLIKYKNGFNLTEGINEIGHYENCFWLIDIICHQKKYFDVELWKFTRDRENLFTLTGKNKLEYIFVELHNLESNFYFDNLTILKKGKLLCLPIEEDIY